MLRHILRAGLWTCDLAGGLSVNLQLLAARTRVGVDVEIFAAPLGRLLGG